MKKNETVEVSIETLLEGTSYMEELQRVREEMKNLFNEVKEGISLERKTEIKKEAVIMNEELNSVLRNIKDVIAEKIAKGEIPVQVGVGLMEFEKQVTGLVNLLIESMEALISEDKGELDEEGVKNKYFDLAKKKLSIFGLEDLFDPELNIERRSEKELDEIAMGIITGKYYTESSMAEEDRKANKEVFRPMLGWTEKTLELYGDDIGFVYQDISKAVESIEIQGRSYPVFNEIQYIHDKDREIIVEKIKTLTSSNDFEKIRKEETKKRINNQLMEEAKKDSKLAEALQVYMQLTGKDIDSLADVIIEDQEGKKVSSAPLDSSEGNASNESEKETIIIDINKD